MSRPWVKNTRDNRLRKDDVEYCIEDQDFDQSIDLEAERVKGKLLVQFDGITVEFAVFEWASGECSDGSPDTYVMVFRGCGLSASLRELRHTWWGEPNNEGYIFYPDFRLLESAFRELRRWFDV